ELICIGIDPNNGGACDVGMTAIVYYPNDAALVNFFNTLFNKCILIKCCDASIIAQIRDLVFLPLLLQSLNDARYNQWVIWIFIEYEFFHVFCISIALIIFCTLFEFSDAPYIVGAFQTQPFMMRWDSCHSIELSPIFEHCTGQSLCHQHFVCGRK